MNIREAIQGFKSHCPNAWAAISPHFKIFKDVDRFGEYRWSYLDFALAFAHGINEYRQSKENPDLDEAIIFSLTELTLHKKYNFPHFFITENLFEAVMKSDIQFIVEWKEMRLPFESFTFVFPKNPRINPENFDCMRVLRFDSQTPFFNDWTVGDTNLRMNTDKGLFIITLFRGRQEIAQARLCDVYDPKIFGSQVDPSLTLTERESIARLPKMVFNLLYAMAARPEYVERGHKIGTHKKSKSEIWSPNIIGRKFAVKRDGEPQGAHASPRMHWRRGHFRQQHFGIGRTESKIIWIEPMLINPMEAKAA